MTATNNPNHRNKEKAFVTQDHVRCDGGALAGHPVIYLHIKEQEVQCPYCSKIFALEEKQINQEST